MKVKTVAIAGMMILFSGASAYAQSNQEPFAACDSDKKVLAAFDAQLRSVLESNNFEKFTGLFGESVSINYKERNLKISKSDTKALAEHKSFIFSDRFRQSVLNEKKPDCVGYRGLMYAQGKLWVNVGDKVEINAFNIDDEGPKVEVTAANPEIIFECATSKHKVIVDLIEKKNYRYRSWAAKGVTEKPELEVLYGIKTLDGTCGSYTLTFKNGDTSYSLQTTCESKDPSPLLKVVRGDKTLLEEKCIR